MCGAVVLWAGYKRAFQLVCVCARGVDVRVRFFTAERLVRPERPGVMSDARGGFLPTSPLACWLTNGLLSGLADRLAGSQWLRLPYLVVESGGWWWQGSGVG